MKSALDFLDAALEADWPEDGDTIKAILDSAQACEGKLAEVINKAKELLANKPLQAIALHDPYFPND